MQKLDLFDDNKVLLFHGSKSGICGDIKPISRKLCDFGCGFYLGDNAQQPKSLIANRKFTNSVFYEVELDLAGLSVYRFDADLDWALFIAYNREIIALPAKLKNRYKQINQNSDVIVGLIADDSMTLVLNDFYRNLLTDAALIEALKYVNLGNQYVLKTTKACKQVRILHESILDRLEREKLEDEALIQRKSMASVVDSLRIKYLRQGSYFYEIVGDLQ